MPALRVIYHYCNNHPEQNGHLNSVMMATVIGADWKNIVGLDNKSYAFHLPRTMHVQKYLHEGMQAAVEDF